MKIIEKELNTVKDYIKRDFDDPLNSNSLLNFITGASKRIRSGLAILYLMAHGREVTDGIYTLLAAGELIHDSSLLQDDILDDADKRRNSTTIAKEYCAKISILASDYLLASATEKLLALDNKEILEIFKDCSKKMSTAEINQYFLRGQIPSEEEYLEICKNKTASLFVSIFMSAAILSGLNISNAATFAEKFGILFQIINDLEDISAKVDAKNKITTAIGIFGVEKTQLLLDNYREEMRDLLKEISDNSYKKALEELIEVYGQRKV